VAVAIVGVQFFALSRGLCRYAERLVGHDAAFRVLSGLRVRVCERLEQIAPFGLPAFRGGDLLARLVHDVDSLQDLLLRVVPAFAIALLVGAATVGLTAWMLPAAGVILLATLLISGVVVPWLAGRLAARAEPTASVVDLLEGAPELVANGVAGDHLRDALATDAEMTRIARATARTAGVGQGLTTLCSGLAMWGTLLVGVEAVRDGRLDGVLLAGLALIPLVALELVAGLPAATQTLQRVRRAAARVFEALDAEPPVTEPANPIALGEARLSASGSNSFDRAPGHVLSVRDLGSSYPGARRAALTGIDLDLSPGRRVAVVGVSGAGKSTLAGVLLRFLPYGEGSVALDGIEVSDLDSDEYRRVVGCVSQDVHVFDTTIEENLRLARRDATPGELRAALSQARLLEWVEALPKGLQTEMGEQGMRMSGGQRQRLEIARAMLANFPILIVDEPGEHLDTETGDAIVADLLAAERAAATLLITHRLAGVRDVEEIVVLDHGRVLERGTHSELLASGGRYCSSWERESAFHARSPTESWGGNSGRGGLA
jgi:thiol reductant ABC exporter CydC subunit